LPNFKPLFPQASSNPFGITMNEPRANPFGITLNPPRNPVLGNTYGIK
jgi:hypothetical protein